MDLSTPFRAESRRRMAGAALLLAAGALFCTSGHVSAQTSGVSISVDAAANRHPINPNIYGVAYATPAQLADLNAPLNRRGGNNTTRYNWQQNADNRGSDWYFESLPYSGTAAGADADQFVSDSKTGGAQPMLTIPTIGWVAKLGPSRGRLSSFSVAKYGAQQSTDAQWFPDAGNGVRTTGANITGNDPNDASVLVDSTFQQGWVNHLTSTWGAAQSGGVRYYLLDNEPSIWQSTHRDVQPTGATMDDIRDRILDYGAKVKQADPGAIVAGPEEWGWSGYFYSGYDQQYGAAHNWSSYPDRAAHGNWDYLPYILDQLRQKQAATGQRVLDVFTVHYYPQGGEFSDDTSSAMQLRRNRSTRSLWDPNYVDETWINDKVQLIPRLRGWVSTYYPGTQIGITEYNWGAEGHINGATTQADIYGIFGREGLDMATRWTTPDTTTPTYKAMKLFRNYDGAKSGFGDVSVLATAPNPDNLSAFAAQRTADGALTVVLVNKSTSAAPVNVSLANFTAFGNAQAWQLTSANAIARLADVPASGGVSTTLPAQSITLLVVPGGASAPAVSVASLSVSPTSVTAGGTAQGIVSLSGAAPAGGVSVSLSSNSTAATVPGSVSVPAGSSSASFAVGTGNVSAATTATITGTLGASSQSATLTVNPAPVTTPVFSATATAQPASVSVGSATALSTTVTCTSGSLANGIVDLEVYDSASAKVAQQSWSGQSFNAGQGQSYSYSWTPTAAETYTVKIGVFNRDWSTNFYWNNGAATVTASSVTLPSVASVSLNPATVTGGASSQGTVTLSGAAPAGGASVSLSSNSVAASVPATVTVPAGSSSATFAVSTTSVTTSTTATITATYGGSSKSATLTVQPPAPAAPTFSGTVSVSPASVKANGSTTITATVKCLTGSLNNGIVDVEIYNSAGARVKQTYWTAQTFTTGQTRTNKLTWSTGTRGTYTVRLGVFTSDWSGNPYWNNAAATITVK